VDEAADAVEVGEFARADDGDERGGGGGPSGVSCEVGAVPGCNVSPRSSLRAVLSVTTMPVLANTVESPRMTAGFDVFLSHNSKDKRAARKLARALRGRGLKVWLDEWELVPGQPWQVALEEMIETTRSAAVLVGRHGMGPWQNAEVLGCLSEFVNRKLPVITVLLRGAPAAPRLPLGLKPFAWVDLRNGLTQEGLDRIQWGVTGKRPDRSQRAPDAFAAPEAPLTLVESKPKSAAVKPVQPGVEAPAKLNEPPDRKARTSRGVPAWAVLMTTLMIAGVIRYHYLPIPGNFRINRPPPPAPTVPGMKEDVQRPGAGKANVSGEAPLPAGTPAGPPAGSTSGTGAAPSASSPPAPVPATIRPAVPDAGPKPAASNEETRPPATSAPLATCISGEVGEENGIAYVRICSGTFTMGSAESDQHASREEKPAHQVTLSEFWMGKTEVTNEQYRSFRPDHQGEANLPAVNLSWTDAQAACKQFGGRIPTEAEWEYAVRAGSRTAWSFGDDAKKLGEYAWYNDNSGGKPQEVGKKKPNAWGLHDMHGNVWEWVADVFDAYSPNAQTDPTGPAIGRYGEARVIRGGSLDYKAELQRSAYRIWYQPQDSNRDIGFRCARGTRPRS
jgi:formylglycine-generating enzyme required for sulfatase activity/nucleotide-binding universal stress UspA family protein